MKGGVKENQKIINRKEEKKVKRREVTTQRCNK